MNPMQVRPRRGRVAIIEPLRQPAKLSNVLRTAVARPFAPASPAWPARSQIRNSLQFVTRGWLPALKFLSSQWSLGLPGASPGDCAGRGLPPRTMRFEHAMFFFHGIDPGLKLQERAASASRSGSLGDYSGFCCQARKSARARSARRWLRSRRSRTICERGGNRPKFALMGWKVAGSACVI